MEKILELIIDKLVGIRCSGVELIDVQNKTPLTEYYIVATARTESTINGTSQAVSQVLKENNYPIDHIEYRQGSLWCLMDCTHFIVHIFAPGERNRIKFEDTYKNCPVTKFGEEDNDVFEDKNIYSSPKEIETWR
jgi:iojap-like protein